MDAFFLFSFEIILTSIPIIQTILLYTVSWVLLFAISNLVGMYQTRMFAYPTCTLLVSRCTGD